MNQPPSSPEAASSEGAEGNMRSGPEPEEKSGSMTYHRKGDGLFAYASLAPAGVVRNLPIAVLATEASENKATVSRERRRLTLAVGITLLYVVVLACFLWLGTTESASVGINAQRDYAGHWIVTYVVPAGLAYDAKVSPNDVVIAVNGKAVETSAAPIDLAHASSITVRSSKGLGDLAVDTTIRRSEHMDLQRVAYTILGLIFIAVGGPVYVKARQRKAASAFYMFCIFTAFTLAIAPVAYLALGWALSLLFVVLAFWAGSFVFFFSRFPVELGKTRVRRRLFLIALVGSGALLLLSYSWVLAGHTDDYPWVQAYDNLYIAGCVILGLGILGKALVTEKSTQVRQQLAILVGGTVLALAPALLLSLVPIMIFGSQKAYVDIGVTVLALGIMPLSFAYAITQHQLLGIRSFARRSVVYLVLGLSVLILFSLGTGFVSTMLEPNWAESGWVIGLFVFLIALSFRYAQSRVEDLVDKFIYHDAYNYQEELMQFSAQLATEQNLHMLAGQLVERTCRLMNLSCGVLLLAIRPDEKGSLDWAKRSYPGLDTGTLRGSMHFGPDGPNMTTLLTEPGLEHVVAREEPRYDTGGHRRLLGRRNQMPAAADEAGVSTHLVAYAKYGENADALLRGLERELAHLGVGVEDDSPVRLLFLDPEQNRPGSNQAEATRMLDGEHPLITIEDGTRPLTGSLWSNVTGTPDEQKQADIEGAQSFLGVPLWTRSRFVGVLCLGGKRTGERFTRDDIALISTLGGQAALAIYNAQLYEMREQALLDTIAALAHAIEAKDTYTINHCEKITDRAVALAQALSLTRQEIENIRLASILHDVGKIGVPDAILNKPSKLTSDEYEVVKQHADIGARIVQSVGALAGVAPIIRHHQERYDGSGYPDGLIGEEIPVGSRIIAVVDAYGAMTEDRVYRKALGHEAAIVELKKWAGRQFDPTVAGAFIRLLKEQPDLAETPRLDLSLFERGSGRLPASTTLRRLPGT